LKWAGNHNFEPHMLGRMAYSGMLHRVALVRTDVSEDRSDSIIRVTIIGELGTVAVTNNRRMLRSNTIVMANVSSSPILVTLMMEALRSSETSVQEPHIPEDILHSHHRGNLKSYVALSDWALQRRRNVSHVRYELGFYIPKDDIRHSHRRGNLKS
jgi:hypothetical protein